MGKELAKKDDRQITLSASDLKDLIKSAVREAQGIPVGAIGPDVTSRPYRDAILARAAGKKGEDVVICVSPEQGGPIAINGEHPDDFFEVDEEGYATANAGSEKQTSAEDLVARAEAAAARSEAALSALRSSEAAALAAANDKPKPTTAAGGAA